MTTQQLDRVIDVTKNWENTYIDMEKAEAYVEAMGFEYFLEALQVEGMRWDANISFYPGQTIGEVAEMLLGDVIKENLPIQPDSEVFKASLIRIGMLETSHGALYIFNSN